MRNGDFTLLLTEDTLTWQSLRPLDCRDDLSAAQPVECCHESGGGVRQGAVIASIDGVWLDGLQKGQHGGDELRHALGQKRASLDWRRRENFGGVACLDTF